MPASVAIAGARPRNATNSRQVENELQYARHADGIDVEDIDVDGIDADGIDADGIDVSREYDESNKRSTFAIFVNTDAE